MINNNIIDNSTELPYIIGYSKSTDYRAKSTIAAATGTLAYGSNVL